MAATNKQIFIQPIVKGHFPIPIVGDTPLLVGHYYENTGERIRDPEKEYLKGLYVIKDDGEGGVIYGFPGSGIKKACVSTCNTHIKGLAKTVLRGAFFITDYLVPIIGSKPEPFTRPVVNRNGQVVQATVAMFKDWKMNIHIEYLPTVVTEEAISNIMEWAGTTIGLGAWRPERNGTMGMFHVLKEKKKVEDAESSST